MFPLLEIEKKFYSRTHPLCNIKGIIYSKSVSILRVHVHCTTVLFCAMAWKLKLMSSLSPGKLQPGQTCKTTANVWLGWLQNWKMLCQFSFPFKFMIFRKIPRMGSDPCLGILSFLFHRRAWKLLRTYGDLHFTINFTELKVGLWCV